MHILSTTEALLTFKTTLSAARLQTYISYVGPEKALDLYVWNARVSSALFFPLQVYEVVIRNAVAEALMYKYGKSWPWSTSFQRSLPKTQRSALVAVLDNQNKQPKTVDDVVASMKFFFWENFFTIRMKNRIWDAYLHTVFPGLDTSSDVGELVKQISNEINLIRQLRNRIAHHEPIFRSPLSQYYDLIYRLINDRCGVTADWMNRNQEVSILLQEGKRFLVNAK